MTTLRTRALPRTARLMTAALATAATVAAALVAASPVMAAPATPGTVVAAATYAGTVFHDEWDYSNSDDMLIDNSGPTMNIANASFSGGLLSFTAEPSDYLSPVWGGYPGSFYMGRDGAVPANRINAAQYNRVSIFMYSSQNVSAAIQWFDSAALNSSTQGGQPFGILAGWHEYEIPLTVNRYPNLHVNWSGTIEGVRLALSPASNTSIQLDSMRLFKTDAADSVTLPSAGTSAAPFWTNAGNTSCPTPSRTCGPVKDANGTAIPTSTGSITFDASGYPAGTTFYLGTPGTGASLGGQTVTVEPRPEPTVDTPSAKGCNDYASSTLGASWLSSLSNLSVDNATNVSLSGGKLTATNTSNDPHVYFRLGSGGIDSTVWKYLSVTESYSGSFNLLNEPGGGTMARAMWSVPGQSLSQTADLLTYKDRPTITVDMSTPASQLTETDSSVRYGWTPGPVNSLRWDPNEDPGARTWTLSNITLGEECQLGSGYSVTWHDPGWVAGTTAQLEAIENGVVHPLATVAETSGENSYTVKSGALPAGDATIRVISTSPIASVTGTADSATPLHSTVPATRIYGADRYATSVAASKTEFPNGTGTVLIASGANYPDALAAAPAAAAEHGALLLTAPGSLPSAVASELKRLKPSHVYLIGGPSAISNTVASQIKSASGVTAQRVYGADRFATSAQIAAKFFPSAPSAFVATGLGFPDALSAASAAAQLGAPVLLVTGTGSAPSSAVAAQLTRLKPAKLYAVGGTAVISNGMAATLAHYGAVTRLAGADRWGTAAVVGETFHPSTSATALIASGQDFPDALVGAVLAGTDGAPLYLSESGCMPAATISELDRLGVTHVILTGGPAALSADVAAEYHC